MAEGEDKDAAVPSVPANLQAEGKTTVEDKGGVVGRMVAYRLLHSATEAMVNALTAQVDRTAVERVLVVEDRNLIASDWPYSLVESQLGAETASLQSAIERIKPLVPATLEPPSKHPEAEAEWPASLATLTAATALTAGKIALNAVSGAVGMLRTDFTITGGEAKVGSTPLVAATAEALREAGRAVVVDGFELVDGGMIETFRCAWELRVKLGAAIRAARLRSSLDAGENDADSGHATDGGRRIPTEIVASEADAKAFDEFAKTVTAVPEKGGLPPLAVAAQREKIHLEAGREGAITHVLHVATEGGGQQTITRKGGFRARNSKVRFLGGIQVSYLLYDVTGRETVAAGCEELLGQVEFDIKKGKAGPVTRIAF